MQLKWSPIFRLHVEICRNKFYYQRSQKFVISLELEHRINLDSARRTSEINSKRGIKSFCSNTAGIATKFALRYGR